MLRSLRWCCAAALGSVLILGAAGCESLNFPWSRTAGLPAQWEPEIEQTAERGS